MHHSSANCGGAGVHPRSTTPSRSRVRIERELIRYDTKRLVDGTVAGALRNGGRTSRNRSILGARNTESGGSHGIGLSKSFNRGRHDTEPGGSRGIGLRSGGPVFRSHPQCRHGVPDVWRGPPIWRAGAAGAVLGSRDESAQVSALPQDVPAGRARVARHAPAGVDEGTGGPPTTGPASWRDSGVRARLLDDGAEGMPR